MRRFALVAGLVALAGCSESGAVGAKGSPFWLRTAPQAERLAYFQEQCAGYGFAAGTPQMAQCMQTEAHSAEARAQRTFQDMANQPVYQPQFPKTTNCNRIGQMINCTTF